jgi:RsiW-degrading membrane proteinase PrsW (M82 family)
MAPSICCVCHRPLEDQEVRWLGGRTYCDEHYRKVTRARPSVWRAGLGYILGQVAFVLIVDALIALVDPVLTGWPLVTAGVGVAVVPALIWLGLFYQQDRLEPEPKGYVLTVFILGAILAQGVGIPLLKEVFAVQRWLPLEPWSNVVGAILVVGITQEFLKYAAVRYSIYETVEFDERIDGVVYATAAALGYATMLNVHYVVANEGVNLQAGVIRIVVTALAQASFAGLSGYFLGRAKFEEEPIWWLPSGLALAAVLNGLFTVARGELTTTRLQLTGGGFNPWPGLVLATVVALATFGGLYYLMRRANRITLSGVDAAQTEQGGTS